MLDFFKKVLVIAPHPDDETLGVGGTISRLSSLGVNVSVLILGGHLPPLYKKGEFEETLKEAETAFKILGVNNWKAEEIPATTFGNIPVVEINNKISSYIKKIKPDTVFIPFPDRHVDHRVTFEGSMVACRPVGNNYYPRLVLAYETLSETHWNAGSIEANFIPDFFIDITKTISKKINALNCYYSQINGNSSRSKQSAIALSVFRGSQNGCENAEAFKLIRLIT